MSVDPNEPLSWEIAKEKEEENKNKETILKLLEFLKDKNNIIVDINARRIQYQKG